MHTTINPKHSARIAMLSCGLSALQLYSPANAQTAATLVVPGKSIGRIALGMTGAQVRKLRGKPTRRVRLSSTLLSEQWGGGYDRDSQVNIDPDLEVTYRSGRVVQIETTLPTFHTRSGLRAGSTLGEVVRRVNPLIHSLRDAPENLVGHEFDGVKMGLAFEMSGPNSGVLYREDEANSLIVHRPGVPSIPNKGSQWISSSSVIVFHDEAGE